MSEWVPFTHIRYTTLLITHFQRCFPLLASTSSRGCERRFETTNNNNTQLTLDDNMIHAHNTLRPLHTETCKNLKKKIIIIRDNRYNTYFPHNAGKCMFICNSSCTRGTILISVIKLILLLMFVADHV